MKIILMKMRLYESFNCARNFLSKQYASGKVRALLALFVYPAITFYLFDLYTHNPLESMNVKTQVLNILFYQFMGLLMFVIFGWLRVALMLQSGLFMLVGIANYYVLSFRSAPIMPWDIYSLGTAASVADNFNYSLEWDTVLISLIFLALLFLESRCKIKFRPNRRKLRVSMLLLSSFLLWNYTNIIQNDTFVGEFGLYDKLFTPTVMNRRNGNVVSFVMEMEYMNVDKPTGYDATKVEELLAGGTSGKDAVPVMAEVGNTPNVIVIMDEAFSDLSVLGDFETNQDYMPYLHSLQTGATNTVTGTMNVSVLGGNTANTEFEFLTGHTMAFLPQGSVAYQQYVNGKVPSLASWFQEGGYSTVAMHPYYASGWERDEVYPQLGFDEFLSIDDFGGSEKIRNYYSDSACFEMIKEIYEEKGEAPLFLFNVTMQNHGGYSEEFANFSPTVKVTKVQGNTLNSYLSLVKVTDQALEDLIDYFEGVEEDTVIVFFGDHQPTSSVSNPIWKLNGKDGNHLTEEEQKLRYQVPFLIWANFDIEEQTGVETSPNYLAGIMMELCGIQMSPYQQELAKVREKYPVISTMQVKDQSGISYLEEDLQEELNLYRQLQYYFLFER